MEGGLRGRMPQTGTILVVDDESDTVDLIRLTLETAGFAVDQALGGSEAIDMIQNGAYDLILLDIMMPEVSGFDVLQQLIATEVELPPVIFLTARKDPQDQTTGRDLGAFDYLTKPTRRGDLLDTIQRALDQSE